MGAVLLVSGEDHQRDTCFHAKRACTEDGADVKFHLLVPTSYAYGIEQPFVINEAIGPLIIKGHRYKSTNLVWFNFVALPRQVTLQCIGNIKDLQDLMIASKFRTYLTFWVTGAMSPLTLLVNCVFALLDCYNHARRKAEGPLIHCHYLDARRNPGTSNHVLSPLHFARSDPRRGRRNCRPTHFPIFLTMAVIQRRQRHARCNALYPHYFPAVCPYSRQIQSAVVVIPGHPHPPPPARCHIFQP